MVVSDQQLYSVSLALDENENANEVETDLESGNELFAVNLGSAKQVLCLVRDLLDGLEDGVYHVRLG